MVCGARRVAAFHVLSLVLDTRQIKNADPKSHAHCVLVIARSLLFEGAEALGLKE